MTALRAKWTIRIDRLRTRLAFGPPAAAVEAHPVQVSLVMHGLARAAPSEDSDCIDHSQVCEWVMREWPRSEATPLLQTRINELLAFVFGFDKRVQDAWVAIRREGGDDGAGSVSVERQVSRSQFEAQARSGRVRPTP